MVEGMVSTVMLVSCRYLKYLWCFRMFYYEQIQFDRVKHQQGQTGLISFNLPFKIHILSSPFYETIVRLVVSRYRWTRVSYFQESSTIEGYRQYLKDKLLMDYFKISAHEKVQHPWRRSPNNQTLQPAFTRKQVYFSHSIMMCTDENTNST